MKKKQHRVEIFVAVIIIMVLSLVSVGAQELDSFDDVDSFSAEFDSGNTVSAVTINGLAKCDMRAYLDSDVIDDEKNAVAALPSFTLDLGYAGSSTELQAKLFVNRDVIAMYPQDMLQELTVRAYFGDFILEGGKMNIVWGKGDKLHVLDNFNANDYTDFIIPDYLDRRLAEPMIRGIWNAPNGIRAELVYTPLMTADRSATEGLWTPAVYTDLVSAVRTVIGFQATAALANDNAQALLNAMQKADSLMPDTNTLEYGQAGARITGSVGVFDWGVSYYYGHYKQPTADMSGYVAAVAANVVVAAGDSALPSLKYDMLQVFGLEGAAAFGRVNLRAEAAYYLTKDVTGDDPWVHNNSIQWLFGFDIDLPIHNVNLNMQTTGKYILGNSEIGSGDYALYKALDADYDANDKYTNNKLVINLSDTFLREKLKLECSVLWGIERGDVIVMPKVSYNVKDGMSLIASGLYITGNDDSEFAEWRDNSFVQLGLKYQF